MQIQMSKQLERDQSARSESAEQALATAVKLGQKQQLEAAGLQKELEELRTVSAIRLQEMQEEVSDSIYIH